MAFETENDLFELKEDGLYIWDILRFFVYLDYTYGPQPVRRPKRRLLDVLLKQVRRGASLISFLFRKSRPNLFYIHSRDKMPDGRHFDRNAHDFLQRMAGESHILEIYENPHTDYFYPVSLFNFGNLVRRAYRLFYHRRKHDLLVEKINGQLGLHWNNRIINLHIGNFKADRLFYRWLFRLKRVKRVYTTTMPKGIYCAARECGMEVMEFQHGIIDTGHISYNYPAELRDSKKVYCPDVLLTFSDFWCQDVHFPGKRVVAVGNSVLAADMEMGVKLPAPDPKSRMIVFISGDVFGRSLAELAIGYIRLYPEDTIAFKLHVNQFNHRQEYDDLFRDFPAIRVFTNEQPTEKLILSCSAIVLIQSTVAYQALQAGIPVFIYKQLTYYRHAHIFNNRNVRLIDDASQIVLTGKPNQPGPRDIFFEAFDEKVYQLFSNDGSSIRTVR